MFGSRNDRGPGNISSKSEKYTRDADAGKALLENYTTKAPTKHFYGKLT